MTQTKLFDYQIFDNPLATYSFSNQSIINTINPHSYCVAKHDEAFRQALLQSDILLPDGVGIVLAIKLLHKKRIQKIAGSDLHSFMLAKAQKDKLRIFYLGSSEYTLNQIKLRLTKEYPSIETSFYSPPYKAIFSDEDNRTMIEAVNTFKPDILFVGMTAPKQEKWVHQNKTELQTRIICSIGAVFDFYAGTMKRPPRWLIRIGLEWFGRFVKEPKRMWQRNFHSTPLFLFDVLREKCRFIE